MSLNTGDLLENRYHVVELISQGGMGAIYQGTDTKLKKPVALKENFFQTPQGIAQFEQEALILARLHHPNLPRVTDHFNFENRQYLVMDYIDGEDLWAMVERQEHPLGEAEAVNYIIQVCDAISYLHEQDPPIIHRDVKPQNIKVDSKGKAVLVDFGIAKVSDAEEEYTLTGARGVTPGFSPPEQYSVGGTTKTSDVYALGATLYAVITGVKPPDSISLITGKARLTSPELINTNLTPEIAYVIKWAMQASQDTRPQNVMEWQAKLASVEVEIKAEEGGETTRLSEDAILPPVKKARTFTSANTVMAPTLDEDSQIDKKSENSSPPPWAWAVIGIIALLVVGVSAFLVGNGLLGDDDSDDELAEQIDVAATVTAAVAEAMAVQENQEDTQVDLESLVAAVVSTTQAEAGEQIDVEATVTAALATAKAEGLIQAETATATPTPKPSNTPTAQPATATSTATPTSSPTPISSPTPTATARSSVSNASSAEQQIAFQTDRDGNWEIYIMEADGSELNNLTNHLGADLSPDWSPHDGEIIFSTVRIDGVGLRIIELDSRSITSRFTEEERHRNPRWSPDATQIVFDTGPSIDVANLDRSSGLVLAQSSVQIDGDNYPSWSPDGTQVIFDTEHSANNYDLFTVPSNGSQPASNLTRTEGINEWQAVWSPDGTRILFVSDEDQAIQQVFIMNADTSNRQQLTFTVDHYAENFHPLWSADGSKIIFVSKRDGNNEIYTMDTDGSNPVNLTNHPADDRHPTLSP
ncbi:protein kinase [Anaerolineales bacterium HSG6]|nr:protein kinase [Anaerolineales bacterium HSG6]